MSDASNTPSKNTERPDLVLKGVGSDAWQAFNAMETTKRRHYELLEILDSKKKNYNLDPSESQKADLANLLQDHDEQVQRFTAASNELKQTDSDAHLSLFQYIGAVNQLSSTSEYQH